MWLVGIVWVLSKLVEGVWGASLAQLFGCGKSACMALLQEVSVEGGCHLMMWLAQAGREPRTRHTEDHC